MNPTPTLLDVAWPARPEDAATCARRFARMQEGLSLCHPSVRRWYEVGSTPEAASLPLPLAASSLARRFDAARSPAQPNSDVDEGFDLLAWNGGIGPRHASLTVRAGSDRPADFMNDMCNSVGITFEPAEAQNLDLLTVESLRPILLTLIDAWQPATANVSPMGLVDYIFWHVDPPELEQLRFYGGWMTYLGAPWRGQIVPPPEALVEETPDGGLLMLATADRFDLLDPTHRDAAYAIHRSLEPLWLRSEET